MLYTDITEQLYKNGLCTTDKYLITIEELTDFHNYLLIDDSYQKMFNVMESHTDFYNVCPLFAKVFPPDKREELFYAEKNKYFMEGVSSKFIYLLKKSMSIYNTPNMILSMLKYTDITNHLIKKTSSKLVPYDVICNVLGTSCNLLSFTKKKVKVDDDTYELYITNVDRVAVVGRDIADVLQSTDDLNNLEYSSTAGITLYGKPIRCMAGHFGIALSDFDLRGCM